MVDEKLIHEELDRILSTKSISSSPILSRFLRFVVTETLAGREHQIKEYTIGVEVLGRDGQFKSNSDASVRIHAIRLRKMLDEYYDLRGQEATIRIEIPKGQYKPVFSYISSTAQEHKNYYEVEVIPEDSICIMPFRGFINNRSLDFSTVGFCQYLSEKLSLFQDITVCSFASINRHIEEGGNVQQLGEKFGITYYLTGSLEIDEQNILVSVQMYDAKTNDFIWAHEFSAEVTENSLMTIVENITSKIVASLAGYSGYIHYKKFNHVHGIPEIPNTLANAVFWFYRYEAQHTEEIFNQAVTQLEKAIQHSPDCSLCYAVLAHLYADSIIYKYKTVDEPIAAALTLVEKSLAFDPGCQHAYLSLAWINIIMGNRSEAIVNLDKSYNLNPNSSFFAAVCSLGYAMIGEYEIARELHEKAIVLNPLPYWWMSVLRIFLALKKKNFSEALFHAQKKGTPKAIYEYVFEMIACYHLKDERSLKEYMKLHQQKFPDALEYMSHTMPIVIYDQEVKDLVIEAFDHIRNVMLIQGSVKTVI